MSSKCYTEEPSRSYYDHQCWGHTVCALKHALRLRNTSAEERSVRDSARMPIDDLLHLHKRLQSGQCSPIQCEVTLWCIQSMHPDFSTPERHLHHSMVMCGINQAVISSHTSLTIVSARSSTLPALTPARPASVPSKDF